MFVDGGHFQISSRDFAPFSVLSSVFSGETKSAALHVIQ